jgi:hypothetical protein
MKLRPAAQSGLIFISNAKEPRKRIMKFGIFVLFNRFKISGRGSLFLGFTAILNPTSFLIDLS